jgi:hypothetical protein
LGFDEIELNSAESVMRKDHPYVREEIKIKNVLSYRDPL